MPEIVISEWKELPDEIIIHIMSYWRPRVELGYLDQLKTVNLIKSFDINIIRRCVNRLITFRELYLQSKKFREYAHEQLECYNPVVMEHFYAECAGNINDTPKQNLIRRATLCWSLLKTSKFDEILINIHNSYCMLYKIRFRQFAKEFKELPYNDDEKNRLFIMRKLLASH